MNHFIRKKQSIRVILCRAVVLTCLVGSTSVFAASDKSVGSAARTSGSSTQPTETPQFDEGTDSIQSRLKDPLYDGTDVDPAARIRSRNIGLEKAPAFQPTGARATPYRDRSQLWYGLIAVALGAAVGFWGVGKQVKAMWRRWRRARR